MKIVLVSYYFSPLNSPASTRLFSFAKYLAEYGNQVTVVTRKWSGDFVVDESGFDVIRIASGSQGSGMSAQSNYPVRVKSILRNLGASELLKLIPLKHHPRDEIRWLRLARNAVDDLVDAGRCEILVTSHPVSEVIKLGAYAKRRYGDLIKWVIDYRDLFSNNHMVDYYWWVRRLLRVYERVLTRGADGAVYASEGIRKDSVLYRSIPTDVVFNGYLDDPQQRRSDKSKVRSGQILYAGSLYGGLRDIETFVKVLKRRSDLTMVAAFFDEADSHYFNGLIKKFRIDPRRVSVRLGVPRNEIRMLEDESEYLLICLRKDGRDKAYPTAKLFDYLYAGKYIIGVGSSESEAARIVQKTHGGVFAVSVEDIEGALYNREKPIVDRNELKQFDRAVQAAHLLTFCKQVLLTV